MGVDSRAYIPSLNRQELKSFLSYISNFHKIDDYDFSPSYKTMDFTYQGEDRGMHTHDINLNTVDAEKHAKENGWKLKETDYWSYVHQDGLPKDTKGLLLDLRLWGHAVEILKMICFRYGGWLDESDSDDEGFYKIDKDYKKIIPLIFT